MTTNNIQSEETLDHEIDLLPEDKLLMAVHEDLLLLFEKHKLIRIDENGNRAGFNPFVLTVLNRTMGVYIQDYNYFLNQTLNNENV